MKGGSNILEKKNKGLSLQDNLTASHPVKVEEKYIS